MKKLFTISMAACVALMAMPLTGWAYKYQYTRKPQVIEDANYPTKDVKVIELNLLDYVADANKGNSLQTTNIQDALNFLGDQASYPTGESQAYRKSGGVLYLPAGVYKVDGRINVPRGVTIRGDWKKPVKGEKIDGTIIKVTNKYANDTLESNSCFIMEPSTMVEDIAIWYEEQNADAPIAYPPSIVMGKKGYFGNDYCWVKNVTLVNAYTGVIFSELNGGGCPNIFGLYGTPLHKGVTMDNIADVGRFDHIDFSPKYWAGSGLANAADASAWTYNHACGFEMRRNDWSYLCNYYAEKYERAIWDKKSPEHMSSQSNGSPNGHNYNLVFTDCKVGVYQTESAGCGRMYTRLSTPGCLIGIEQAAGEVGPTQYLDCDIYGSRQALYTHSDASQTTQLMQCRVNGFVDFQGGQLIADNCTFNGNVEISALSRCIFTANKFTSGQLINNSLYECQVDNTPRTMKAVPQYTEDLMEIKATKPAKNDIFLATDYGAVGTYISPADSWHKEDATINSSDAIQKALDAAGANGGGIVYLTPGHYRIESPLSVPTGVELRGASDIGSVPRGQGAILEVYCGEGSATGTPLITLAPKAGIRGISINYPAQDENIFTFVPGSMQGTTLISEHFDCKPKLYPYAVRGNADTYVVNLAIRACYQGVDMFTNKCDNHYVDYISGHAFKNVIRVGGNSENGTISNIQCNTIGYAAGDEWKFGLWPNSEKFSNNYDNGLRQDACYQQNYDELDFFIIGDCKNENLYNNFLFGSSIGMLFQSDGNGGASFYSLGNAVDGVVNTFVFRATQGDCDLTNTQLVALNNGHSANFITLEEGYKHTVNMFSTNNWGGGDTFAKVHGGTANFFCAALQQNGNRQTFDVPNGGKFNMYNFNVRSGNENCNGNKNVSLYSGVFTPRTCENLDASSRKYTSFDTNLLAAYTNMLPVAWNLTNRTGFITDRSKWHVIAFNDIYGKVYDRDGNLVEGQQSKTFVFGDDEYYSNEGALYNRLPGDGLASRATDGDMSTRWSSKGPQSAPIWVANYKDDKVTLDETMPYKSNPLQWYTIFFDQDIFYPERTEKINAVILDASESSNDGPSAWRLQVYVGDEEDENEIIYHTDKTPDALKNKYPGAFQDYEEVTDEEYEMYDGSYGQPHTWKTVASGSSGGSLLICPFPEQECKGVRILQMGNKGNYWSMEEVYVGNIAGLQVSGIEDTMLNEEKNLFFAEGTLIIAASLFNADGTAPVEIYDLAGRMVRNFTATTGQITLDDLNKGVYIVRVKGSSLKFMN